MSTGTITTPNPGTDPNNLNPGSTTGANDDQEVKLTQSKLDDIVRKAMGRAAADVRKELEAAKRREEELQQQLEEAKQAAASTTSSSSDRKDAKDDVEALTRKIEEMKSARVTRDAEFSSLQQKIKETERQAEQARQEALEEKKSNLIARSASKMNFVNMDVVKSLTDKNIKWNSEDKKWTVVNEDGSPKMNSDYDPMSVEQFYQDFAVKNPFLVRSDVITGNGSTASNRSATASNQPGFYQVEQIFGKKANGRLAQDLFKSNPREYERLRAEAVSKGILARK